jgi:hypothetical protein
VIPIAIKNRSKKITDRFLVFNRLAIFPKKSILDFYFQTGSRLKNRLRNQVSVVIRVSVLLQIWLTFPQPDPDFSGKTGS